MTDRCGYCHKNVEGWNRTPHGRRFCPHCGAIPADEQRAERYHSVLVGP